MAFVWVLEQWGFTNLKDFRYIIAAMSFVLLVLSTIFLVLLLRLASILGRTRPEIRPSSSECPTHLMIVLGSGGHTAEMLNILSSIQELDVKFTHRTYVVSSGDGFSALKAKEFEENVVRSCDSATYSVATVLRGKHLGVRDRIFARPDLILTNGPGTGVCVIVASIMLLFVDLRERKDAEQSLQGQMRTVFVESWARVKTLSLSGRILRPVVNRFIVQWPQLANPQEGIEYIGPLVS